MPKLLHPLPVTYAQLSELTGIFGLLIYFYAQTTYELILCYNKELATAMHLCEQPPPSDPPPLTLKYHSNVPHCASFSHLNDRRMTRLAELMTILTASVCAVTRGHALSERDSTVWGEIKSLSEGKA